MVGTHASGQGNLSAPHSSRGGSRYAPRESVGHRENPPVVPVVVKRPGPAQPPGLQETLGHHERVLTELREDVYYEYDRRHDLQTAVRRVCTDRENYISNFSFVQLESERDNRRLREELESARRETASLMYQLEGLVRDHKNLLGIFEYGGCLRSRKRSRTDSTGGDD